METISRVELKNLASFDQGPCVSIYMPRNRAAAEAKQDALHLRHLLEESEQRLLDMGQRRPDVDALLEPARKLQQDRKFWSPGPAESLCLLLAPGMYREFHLAYPCEQLSVVGDTFHVSNLAHGLVDSDRFLLLALSPKDLRLYQHGGGVFSLIELPKDMPENMDDALRGTEFDRSLQFHTTSAVTRGNFVGVMHGHGTPNDNRKMMLAEYFRITCRHLEKFLNGEGRPLIVAAVDYYHPMFRDACGYRNLLPEGIEASPDELTEKELFERAVPLAKEHSRSHLKQERERYCDALGTDRTCEDLEGILDAANNGRIDMLFAKLGAHYWGRKDLGNGHVELHDERQADDVDLMDWSVREALLHSRETFVVESEEMPNDRPLAALLRW